jgi:hypothetical protein
MRRLLPTELARLLRVSTTTLERATRRTETCRGHPVAEWVLRRGRQVYYEVPDNAAEALQAPDAQYLKAQSRVLRTLMRGDTETDGALRESPGHDRSGSDSPEGR